MVAVGTPKPKGVRAHGSPCGSMPQGVDPMARVRVRD